MGGGLLRRLGIEPGEGRVFGWGAASLFVFGWANVSVKNVSETIFIKRTGVEDLPLYFFISMALLVPTTWAIGRVTARADRLRLLPLVFAGLALLLLPLWFLVLGEVASSYALLLISAKQIHSIALLVFWIALGDLLDGRQAKRLFPPLMAGVTFGTMIGSFASEPLSRMIGIDGLLPFSAVGLLVAGVLAVPLRRFRPAQLERAARGRSSSTDEDRSHDGESGFRQLWRESGLFRLLFVSVAASGLLAPMLYVQFQYVANVATEGEDGLLAFYSQFRGWISVGTLVAQIAITSQLYRRIGVPLAAAISPLIYLFGFFGLSVRLSLPAGVGAMSGTKLQDDAVYDPALRILYTLFPERLRSRASALLEGPVKRGGGAIGNLITFTAIKLGGVPWIGYLALPIAASWLVASLVLRRAYPGLLLQVAAHKDSYGEEVDIVELLDATTLRAMAPHLRDPDPERCGAVIELVSEARPERAVAAFAEAAREAPRTTRPLLVGALDRIMEKEAGSAAANRDAARHLAALLEDPGALPDADRADVVQAYGRLTDALARQGEDHVLQRALLDTAPSVRLAAVAALHRRGKPPPTAPDLDAALREGLAAREPGVRRTAREELRAVLLCTEPGPVWDSRLQLLAGLLEDGTQRAAAAEAIAEVAKRHGERAVVASEAMLALRDHDDPRIRAAGMRFAGHTGQRESAPWIVSHLAWDGAEDADRVRVAASEGVKALGSGATDALLVELSFGKRSTRDAIVPLLRELKVDVGALRGLFDGEVDSVRHRVVSLAVLVGAEASPMVIQRLGEQVDEGLHTALLLTAAIHDESRIAELADPLKRARGGRRYAILLEALEAFLTPSEKAALVPLLEDRPVTARGRAAARALGIPLPTPEEVIEVLRTGPEELMRILIASTLPGAEDVSVAAAGEVLDHGAAMKPVECALVLSGIPLFESLTVRQLMDLAGVMVEETFEAGAPIVQEGEHSDCMYVIVEGAVDVSIGGKRVSQMGPKDFFGEIATFTQEERTASVVARNPVKVLRLERSSLLRLLEELPAIAITVCEALSKLVSSLTDRLRKFEQGQPVSGESSSQS